MYYWKFTDNVVLGLQEMLPKSCYKELLQRWPFYVKTLLW